MRWVDWKFSTRLAAQDSFVRWPILAAMLIVVGMSSFFLWRLLPEGWQSGVITLHYNVYLGIDDVRSWPWMFAIPASAIGLLLLDMAMVVALHRHNPLASRMISMVCFVSAVLWALGSFFLILINA